jgi:hypothetical protein
VRERVSLLGLPTTCNNNSFFQKSPKIRTGRKNHQIAAAWRSGSQEEEKNYWQAFGHNRVANVHQGMQPTFLQKYKKLFPVAIGMAKPNKPFVA